MKGRYIVFEGIDGCGKTSQAKRLAWELARRGADVRYTREPGGDLNSLAAQGLPVRDFILNSAAECAPTTLELVLQTDRAQHTFEILDALQKGVTVISDRSFVTGLAYAVANGHSLERILPLVDFAVDVLPDELVLLDCSIRTAYARMNNGAGAITREEVRGEAFMTKVRKNFLDLLFSPLGRDHDMDILRQLDQVCNVRRISTEHDNEADTAALVDQFLGGRYREA